MFRTKDLGSKKASLIVWVSKFLSCWFGGCDGRGGKEQIISLWCRFTPTSLTPSPFSRDPISPSATESSIHTGKHCGSRHTRYKIESSLPVYSRVATDRIKRPTRAIASL